MDITGTTYGPGYRRGHPFIREGGWEITAFEEEIEETRDTVLVDEGTRAWNEASLMGQKRIYKNSGRGGGRRRRSTRYAWIYEYRARITLFSLRFESEINFFPLRSCPENSLKSDTCWLSTNRSWQKLKLNIYEGKLKNWKIGNFLLSSINNRT